MNFIKSMIFGSEGSYNILGTQVHFTNQASSDGQISLEGAGIVSRIALACLNSNTLRYLTQGYSHVFIHEMGHALADRLLTHKDVDPYDTPSVYISKESCGGENWPTSASEFLPEWKKTILDVAGPMADIAFSSCKIVAATSLKNYLPLPVTLALGGAGALWIFGELVYAYTSVLNKDGGDFSNIAERGNVHLALASTAVVSQVALAIFTAISLS